jgi:hypothetical protein
MKKTKGTARKKDSITGKVLHVAFELRPNKWKLGLSDVGSKALESGAG